MCHVIARACGDVNASTLQVYDDQVGCRDMTIGICPTVEYAFKLLVGRTEHVRVTIFFSTRSWITRLGIRTRFASKTLRSTRIRRIDSCLSYFRVALTHG